MLRFRRLAVVVLTTALSGALALVPATPASAYTDSENRISLSRSLNGVYQVVTVRPDGTGPRQLTKSAGNKCDPAMSPDGSSVAFATGNRIGVAVASGTGAEENAAVIAASEYVRQPSWSADGRTLVYVGSVGYDGGAASSWTSHLYSVTRVDGVGWSQPQALTSHEVGYVLTPDVSSVGDIAYSFVAGTDNGSPERDLYLLEGGVGAPVQITSLPGTEQYPDWHATDPNLLVFAGCSNGVNTLRLGGKPVPVNNLGVCQISWSTRDPGKLVYGQGGRVGVYDIARGRTTVIDKRATDRQPHW